MGRADPRPVVGIALEKQLGQKIWPVHRLDEEVSGLLVFAFSAEAHRAANNWFESHQIRKIYEALTRDATNEFTNPAQTQTWTCKLMRGKKRAYEASFGKDCITSAMYKEQYPYGNRTVGVWHLEPHTGRSHQLRFEMARHGMPILGDVLYGSPDLWEETGIALRSVLLDFTECPRHIEFELPGILSLSSVAEIATKYKL